MGRVLHGRAAGERLPEEAVGRDRVRVVEREVRRSSSGADESCPRAGARRRLRSARRGVYRTATILGSPMPRRGEGVCEMFRRYSTRATLPGRLTLSYSGRRSSTRPSSPRSTIGNGPLTTCLPVAVHASPSRSIAWRGCGPPSGRFITLRKYGAGAARRNSTVRSSSARTPTLDASFADPGCGRGSSPGRSRARSRSPPTSGLGSRTLDPELDVVRGERHAV